MESGLWSAYSQHYSRLGSRDGPLPLPAHQNHPLLLRDGPFPSSSPTFPHYGPLRASSIQHTAKSPFSSFEEGRFKETDYRFLANSEPGGGGGPSPGSAMWFNSSMASSPWRHHSGIMSSTCGPFGMLPHEAIVSRGHILERRSESVDTHPKSSACMEGPPGGYRSILSSPAPYVDQGAPGSRPNTQNGPYLPSVNDAYYSYLKSGFQAYKSYSSNLSVSSSASAPYCYSQSIYSAFDMSAVKHEAGGSASHYAPAPPNPPGSVIVNRARSQGTPSPMYNDSFPYVPKQGYSPNSSGGAGGSVPYIPGFSMASSPPNCSGNVDFQNYGRLGNQTPVYPPMSTPIPASTPSHPPLQSPMGQAYIPSASHDPLLIPPQTPSTQPPTPASPNPSPQSSLASYPHQSPKKLPLSGAPLQEESLSNPASLSSEEEGGPPMIQPPPHPFFSSLHHLGDKAKLNPYESQPPPVISPHPSVIYHHHQHQNPYLAPGKPPADLMEERNNYSAYSDNSMANSEPDVKDSDCSLSHEGHPLENYPVTAAAAVALDSYASSKVSSLMKSGKMEATTPQQQHYPDSSNSSWVNSNSGVAVEDKAPEPKSNSTAYCESSEYSKSEEECCLDLSHKICPDIEDDLDFLAELRSSEAQENGTPHKAPSGRGKGHKEGFLQSFFSFFDENNPVPTESPSLENLSKASDSSSFVQEKLKEPEKEKAPSPAEGEEEEERKEMEKDDEPIDEDDEEESKSKKAKEPSGELMFSPPALQPQALPNTGTASFSSDEEEEESDHGFSNTVALAIQRLNEDCDDGAKKASTQSESLKPGCSSATTKNGHPKDESGAEPQLKKHKSDVPSAMPQDKEPRSESVIKEGGTTSQGPRKRLITRCKEELQGKDLSMKNNGLYGPNKLNKLNSTSCAGQEPTTLNGVSKPPAEEFPRKKKIKFLKRNCIEGSWILEGQFRTGDFVIAVGDISKPQAPIWRLEGKCLLHRFQPCQHAGRPAYVSTMQYTAWRPAARARFTGLTVRVLPPSPATGHKMVVESLGLTSRTTGSSHIRADPLIQAVHSHRENFEEFLKLMLQQVLDPDTLKKNEYQLDTGWQKLGEAVKEKQKDILGPGWNSLLVQCVDRYPCVSVVVCKERRHRATCQVCHKSPGLHVVQFHGRPYDPTTLRPSTPQSAPSGGTTRFPVCALCVQAVSIYSRLTHHRHHFFHRCQSRINKIRVHRGKECPPASLLLRCLQDQDWVEQMFQELVDLWNASEKLR